MPGPEKCDIGRLVSLCAQMNNDDQLGATKDDVSGKTTLFIGENQQSDGIEVARACVGDMVAKCIGGNQADEILEQVLEAGAHGDGRPRFRKPVPRAITKTRLKQVFHLTYDKLFAQLRSLTFEERHHLIDWFEKSTAEDPAGFMKDPKASNVAHLASSAQATSQNPLFIDAVHAFEQHCEDFKACSSVPIAVHDRYPPTANGELSLWATLNEDVTAIASPDVDQAYRDKLNDLREEAHSIRNRFVQDSARNKIEINARRQQLLCNIDLDQLSPEGLAHVFDHAKKEIAEKMMERTLKPLVDAISRNEWKIGSDPQHHEMEILEAIRDGMDDDDHLGQHDDVMYIKSNHPWATKDALLQLKQSKMFGFWYQTTDAKQAKSSIQDLVAGYFEESLHDAAPNKLARSLMKPWIGNHRALSKFDLAEIINTAKKWTEMQSKVAAALRKNSGLAAQEAARLRAISQRSGSSTDRNMECLEHIPEELRDPFAEFCSIQAMQFVWYRFEFLLALEQSLRSSQSQAVEHDRQRNDSLHKNAQEKARRLLRHDHHLSRRCRQLVQKCIKNDPRSKQVSGALLKEIAKERKARKADLRKLAREYDLFLAQILFPAQVALDRRPSSRHKLDTHRQTDANQNLPQGVSAPSQNGQSEQSGNPNHRNSGSGRMATVFRHSANSDHRD